VPTICEFFGIVIRMYYNDHNPPHFHAYYGDWHAIYEIASGQRMIGAMSRRADALISEWAIMSREALLDDWKLAAEHREFNLWSN